ncbi:hypothetical protein Mgra_00000781 [Meloidogyne graminicola]|uniref:G-patch domain-containing protein n=1 Tax=Meloidogyne graminicola TaxID=189291 RepID=A0A8T0A1C2_9BILA|nr:hypothetical protein Mgra_00000781 [Meloidogyne graminicola]
MVEFISFDLKKLHFIKKTEMSIQSTTIPLPPQDPDLKHTIDSMAEYVAKNGPGSEEVARQQNRNDPRFVFLFEGVQVIAQPFVDQSFQQQQKPSLPLQTNNSLEFELKKAEEQIVLLRKQIIDSESNLKAHEMALNSQRQAYFIWGSKIDVLLRAKEDKRIDDLIKQVGLNISAFDKCLEKLQESGSKETISSTKKWIFDNCTSDRLREIILTFLLHRVRERTATDAFRLHKLDSIRQMLSRYVPKLYAYTTNNAGAINAYSDKLDKLIGVWEGHKYFDESCFKQLRNPVAVIATEQATFFSDQQQLAIEVDKEIAETLSTYAKQHKEYEQHILTKIATLETQIKEIKDRIEFENERRKNEEEQQHISERRRSSRFDQQQKQQSLSSPTKIPSLFESISPSKTINNIPLPPPNNFPSSRIQQQQPPPPPPPPPTTHNLDLTPKVPYYELPAGMIVPLVKLEDVTYQPLKEKDLRLPMPDPPSEQLLREIDRFYSALQFPPPIDCIKDNDGWEMNGLLEHYVKKAEQRTKLEAKLKEEGKTLEDAFTNKYIPPKTPPRYEKTERRRRTRSRSKSSSSTSSSRSSSSGTSRSGSSSSSSSRSRSSSYSPQKKSKSPKRIKRSRSPTPDERPTFAVPVGPAPRASISFKIPPQPINRETNKGAQLMTKMGWEGKGLGTKEQGIEEPVSGGEVRDKTEQFRGLGSKPDIYEQYRKQMSTSKFEFFLDKKNFFFKNYASMV